MANELDAQSDEHWADSWEETAPGTWEARLSWPDQGFDLLLMVRQQVSGGFLGSIIRRDHDTAVRPQTIMRFRPELDGFWVEAVQECTDLAYAYAAGRIRGATTDPSLDFWPEDADWPHDPNTLPTFTLWLEFEHRQIVEDASPYMGWHVTAVLNEPGEITPPGPWADETFFNMSITLSTGEEYCLNVWTHKLFSRALAEDRERGDNLSGKYMLPPDLFVARADRQTIEAVVADLVRQRSLKKEWLCAPATTDDE